MALTSSRAVLNIVIRGRLHSSIFCCASRCKPTLFLNTPRSRMISSLPADAAYYPSPAVIKAISEGTPFIDSCSAVVSALHETINGPFWASLVIITFAARALLTLPLAVLQRQIFLRLSRHRPEFDDMVRSIALQTAAQSKAQQWSEEKTSRVFRVSQAYHRGLLYIKYNCHPARAFLLPLVQIPLWVMLSLGLRGLCVRAQTVPASIPTAASVRFAPVQYDDSSKWTSVIDDLRNGGFGWIQDFSVPDPYFILPVLYALSLFFLAEMAYATFMLTAASGGRQISKAQRFAIQVPRVISLVALPIACLMPAAITFYWLTSMLFGIAQNLLLLSPRVLKALKAMPVDGRSTTSTLLSPQGDVLPKNNVFNELKNHPYKLVFRRMIYRR